MFEFLKAKFEKDAQAAIERRARQLAPDKAPKPEAPKPPDQDAAIAHMQAQVQAFVSPERKALIANAVRVHRAKQQILAELDDESRAKLVAMAITTFLHQGSRPAAKTKKP
ncbi:MAG: hypothetical protein H7Y60_14345 [Rhodospirillaceae bacterium]|nr:hypothetical protein [Rhodospirillales bacterium]